VGRGRPRTRDRCPVNDILPSILIPLPSPSLSSLLALLGQCLVAEGKTQEAEEEFTELLAYYPEDEVCWRRWRRRPWQSR